MFAVLCLKTFEDYLLCVLQFFFASCASSDSVKGTQYIQPSLPLQLARSQHMLCCRSRSRGTPAIQRGPPYPDRPAPRGGRQAAAQQLRSAVYPQEQTIPPPYHTPDIPPIQAHAPPQYEQPMLSYAPEPHSMRRGPVDRSAQPLHVTVRLQDV